MKPIKPDLETVFQSVEETLKKDARRLKNKTKTKKPFLSASISIDDLKITAEECLKAGQVLEKQNGEVFLNTKQETFRKNRDVLREKWRPPGFLYSWELLDLVGKAQFKDDWTGEELEISLSSQPYLDIPAIIDANDEAALISYGLKRKYIKEHTMKPLTSLRGGRPWQNDYDWFFCCHNGKHWGTKTKQEAIHGWLKEAVLGIEQKRRYDAAINRLTQIKNFLRDALFTGPIKAVRQDKQALIDVPKAFWLDDACTGVFSVENLAGNILFEQSAIEQFLANPNSSKKDKALSQDIYDIRSSIISDALNGPRIAENDEEEYNRQYKLFSKHHVALTSALKEAGFSIAEYGNIERLGLLTDRPITAVSNLDAHIKGLAATIIERLDKVLEARTKSPARKPMEEIEKRKSPSKANKKSRRTPMHEDIGHAFQKLQTEKGETPSAHQVLREMNDNKQQYSYFLRDSKSSSGEQVIWYKQASGKEATITRKRFDDIVSDYRTGKK